MNTPATETSPGRHAYCIIAHDDRYCLETLLEMVDDARNDIFILPDSKSPENLVEGLACKKSRLHIVPPGERVDIRWGAPSLVKAELKVLETALEHGTGYSFLHLMSGADLPLKTQDEIHEFFGRAPSGANFIEIADGEANERYLRDRTDYYYPLLEHQRKVGRGPLAYLRLVAAKAIRKGSVMVQKAAGIKRKWGGMKLARGINWASLSPGFSRYLVDNRDYILKKFRGIVASDELYKQTMIINSEFDSTVMAFSRGNSGGIRLMDWQRGNVRRGNPYTWRMEDLDEINEAYEQFARKFSSRVDKGLIDCLRLKLVKKD